MAHPLAKPEIPYTEGDSVEFDLGQGTRGVGRIRGLAMSGLIDTWIVEIVQAEGIDKSVYPYSCVSIPHPQLKMAATILTEGLGTFPPLTENELQHWEMLMPVCECDTHRHQRRLLGTIRSLQAKLQQIPEVARESVEAIRTLLAEWDRHLTRQSARLDTNFSPKVATLARLREVVSKAGT